MPQPLLVNDVAVAGPATHALVIGVGAYPHLNGGIPGKRTEQNDGMEQLPCRLQPTVNGEDHVAIVDEQGIGEAKGFNRVGNLPDLLFGVGARIARVGLQAPKRERL